MTGDEARETNDHVLQAGMQSNLKSR